MQTGVISRLTDRGYGFIKVEDQEKDIFFHANALLNVEFADLREGMKLEFNVEQGAKGPNAVDVKVIE